MIAVNLSDEKRHLIDREFNFELFTLRRRDAGQVGFEFAIWRRNHVITRHHLREFVDLEINLSWPRRIALEAEDVFGFVVGVDKEVIASRVNYYWWPSG